MKAKNPITGELMEYRTLAWAKENNYITDKEDIQQLHSNKHVIDLNETCFIIEVQKVKYYVKR